MGKAIKEEKAKVETIEEVEVSENAEEVKEEKAKVEDGKTYIIYTPNKDYNGLNATVEFKDGVGETSNPVIVEYFVNKGYEVKEK